MVRIPYKCLFLFLFPTFIYASLEVKVSLGFNNNYKVGKWNPIELVIENKGNKEITGNLLLSFESFYSKIPYITFNVPITLPPKSENKISSVIYFPYFCQDIRIKIFSKRKQILEEKIKLNLLSYYHFAFLFSEISESRKNEIFNSEDWILISPDINDLLPNWKAYDSIDIMVFDKFPLSKLKNKVKDAIVKWLSEGRNIILTGDFLKINKNDKFLKRIFDLKYKGEITIFDKGNLISQYLGTKLNFYKCNIADINIPKENVILYVDKKPFISRFNYSRGNIIVLPIFMNKISVIEKVKLLRKLWDVVIKPLDTDRIDYKSLIPDEANINKILPYFYSFICILIILLGPLSYIFLRKLDKREFLLLTIPCISIILAIFSFLIGVHLRGNRKSILKVNTITYLTPKTNLFLKTNYIGILSPKKTNYSIYLKENFYINKIKRSLSRNLIYTFKPSPCVSNINISKWAMEFFCFSTFIKAENPIEVKAFLEDGVLKGEIENNLPFNLKNCYLFLKWNYLYLGEVKKNSIKKFNLKLTPPKIEEKICKRNIFCRNCYPDKYLFSEEFFKKFFEEPLFLESIYSYNYEIFRNPIIIGTLNLEEPKIEITPIENEKRIKNYFILYFPYTINGKEIFIPEGLASKRCFCPEGKSKYVTFRFRENELFSYKFDLPSNNYFNIENKELKIDCRISQISLDKPVKLLNMFIYNWDDEKWEKIGGNIKEDFVKVIEKPDKYVKLPFGFIGIKGECEGSYYESNLRLNLIEIAYKGVKR